MGHGIMFHHFHDLEHYPKGQGSITAEQFDQILVFLKRDFELLSCHEFTHAFCSNTLKENQLTITFDDALKCQYDLVVPVLRDMDSKHIFLFTTRLSVENLTILSFFETLGPVIFQQLKSFMINFFFLLRIKRKVARKKYPKCQTRI